MVRLAPFRFGRALRAGAAALLVTCVFVGTAAAQDCPENIPASSRERRAIAKEWFSRAEAADGANDPISAVKAYQCSLKMVPHGFTAFNLGRLAEKTGDLELAVDAFSTYIKLTPEAPDRSDIEAKITALRQRIETLRAEQVAPPPPPPKPTTEPPPDLKPAPPVEPQAKVEVPPPAPSRPLQLAPWIIGGVGVAALVSGVVLNLGARSKMDDCNALAKKGQIEAASTACDAAKPRAYASYALFGVAAAAVVADSLLLFLMHEPTDEGTKISAAPLPGGALVSGHWRF
jgi:tetratricopeptide (TPR) repeat protein